MHKGIWLRVESQEGTTNDIVNVSSVSEAHYLMRRRFSGHKKIQLFVGSKLLEEREGNTMTMQSFADFDLENPVATSFRPWAKGPEKERLAAFEIPFEIVSVQGPIESQFTDKDGNIQYYYNFAIELDTASPTYQFVSKNFELGNGYTLSLPAGAKRTLHVDKLIKPALDRGEKVLVKMVKDGNGYVFRNA